MAAGTIQVSPVGQQPTRDIFNIIGEKVKKAKDQAVEARQYADKRIEEIEKTPEDELTQNDLIELESLKQKRSQKGYFFKKALKFQTTDKIRTTMGKFQRDPELQNDPAATEKERFYAKTGMFRPGEMPDMTNRDEKNKDIISYVGRGFQMIMDAVDKVRARVNRTAESSEQTSKTASSTEIKTQGVKNSTDNLNNTTETISNVSKQEVNVQQMELNFEQDQEQKREQAEAEARAENQSDVAGTSDVIETDQGSKGGGGLFSSLLDIGGKILGSRRFGSFRRGVGNRAPGASRARLARMRASRMMNPARRNTQYTAPIGPQPMNSPTPWAAEGGGFVPRMPSSNINLSDGGIIAPIKPKKQQKLADGGITGLITRFLPPPLGPLLNMMINPGGMMGGIGGVLGGLFGGGDKGGGNAISNTFQMLTNPTKLVGDGLRAVLPMNRNVGKDVVKGDLGETESMSKLFQLPVIIGGGVMFASMAQVANAIPFLGAIVRASAPIIKPLLQAFGLPASVLSMILGGGASAATMDFGGFGGGGGDGGGGDTTPTTDDLTVPPGEPLTGGTDQFGSVTGTSGSAIVAGVGRSGVSLAVDYSPFSKKDIKEKGISISSGKGSRWGREHKGYDFGAPQGTPLYAYLPGTITSTQFYPGDGNYGHSVEWKDSVYGQTHFFAHMMGPSPFKKGDEINQGDMIGRVGDTGTPGSYHLHWEIGPRGGQVDPGVWVRNHPIVPQTRQTPVASPRNRPSGVSAAPSSVAPTPTRRGAAPRSGAGSTIPSSPGGMATQASIIGVPGSTKTPGSLVSTSQEVAFSTEPPKLGTTGLWPSSYGA